jgi:hypothetical protein
MMHEDHRHRRGRLHRLANNVKALNARGETDILAVDNLKRRTSSQPADCEIADYLDKREFLALSGAVRCRSGGRASTRAPARTRWRPTAAT